jgi:hypothetical protein
MTIPDKPLARVRPPEYPDRTNAIGVSRIKSRPKLQGVIQPIPIGIRQLIRDNTGSTFAI